MPTSTFFNLPEDKRQAILDVAIDEFSENDYRSASVSRIVARAGIAKGSFYQYFKDKQDLYLYLLEVAAQDKTRHFNRMAVPEAGMGLFGYLRWLLRVGVEFQFSNPKLARIGYRAYFARGGSPQEASALFRQSGKAYFSQLVAEGVAHGDLHPALDPDVAAFVFNAVFMELGNYVLDRAGLGP